jgi:hypothetical protein
MKYETDCICMELDIEQSRGSMVRCKSSNREVIFGFTLSVYDFDGLALNWTMAASVHDLLICHLHSSVCDMAYNICSTRHH